ncbi:type IX secretion system protein PorQ [Aurantibacillus circumpalustris]|uniref:type IX secretion system protein PorQ n=1 Tax=Aurantibacillus circumpalustris TaxID=3036359 RepID=UPI00295B00D2|nr:type IX secretion system protein PorQ [Aurantibacillus circumpalustris]
MKKIALLISVFVALKSFSQIGGTKTYRFLDIPMTARAAALGGSNMSIWGDDVNLLHSNPSLLNNGMTKQVGFNYCNYVGDMNFFYLAYAHNLKQNGTAAISVQTYNYGNFDGYDELGQKTNTFKANDNCLNLNYAKPLADSMFNVGIALKTIISQYDVYKSFGNAIDFGVTFHNKKALTISLLVKNVGFIWKDYTTGREKEKLPQTVQLGISKKLVKAPFRLFLVYDQLLKWNLNYVSPIDTTGKSSQLNFSQTSQDSSSFQRFKVKAGKFGDNFMRHIVIGTEIVLSKNFNLRVAYNYRRQKEMTLPERRGFNALSFGFGFKVKRFALSYSFSKMAFPGSAHIFGLTYGW